jgi:hypothetical protein
MKAKLKTAGAGIGLVVVFWFLILPLYAGTTGKIAGRVVDAQTKEPLFGANVMIEGTMRGGATDQEGRYIILNINPGVYTLRVTFMGYKPMIIRNVRVNIDLTTTVDVDMEMAVVETGETVTVVAERPMVVKDQTSTTAVIGSEDIAALPLTEVAEAIELQAGMVKDAGGGLHIRGGRSGEVSYWIDGIPVTDSYDGGTVVEINKDMVQELQVMSGAFNAEYGQAMSGIVNITTKEGSNRLGGNLTTYVGDHISGHDNIFLNVDDFNPLSIRNVEGSLHGALVKDKLFFYVNGRYFYTDGWLEGQRRYNPNAVTGPISLPEELLYEWAPEYVDVARELEDGIWGFQYVLGTNPTLDSLVTYYSLPENVATNPDSFAVYYNRLRENHKNGRGDNEYVPMNWSRKYYTQGKLIFRATPQMKFSYNFILDDVGYNDFERDFMWNPDGASEKFRQGYTHILQMNHAVSSRTFYNVGFSYFIKGFQRYVYEKMSDSRYIHPYLLIQEPYSFKTGGTSDVHFSRETRTLLGKIDLTSQITNTHQIKAGLEFRRHRVFQEDITLRPVIAQTDLNPVFDNPYIETRVLPDSTIYYSRYLHHPAEFSAYIQDKMEFRSMIVNLGMRIDYFQPDGVILADESDPNIYNPIRPENRYHDWGTDGIPNTRDSDGSEGNGIQDAGEPAVTLAERQEYWYDDASSKLQVSPRLGVSFPVTEGGIIHFSYGHFFQIPRFEYLYQNPEFELSSGTGNVGVIGNADLKPEQTISGEIGFQQQLSDDISMHMTGFFRDIRNLTGTRSDEIVIFGGSARYSKFTNSDFGFIRGIILSLNKRYSGNFSASLDYTFQIAKGSNSDPEQARNAIAGGQLPEVQLTPLNWDQTHTVNAYFNYSRRDWGVSLIGQWGSGLPYTPRASVDITTLLTNSQRRPSQYNVDLKAFKDFQLGPGRLSVFLRVFNLFDTLNEVNVFNDTGRAGFTTDQQVAQATNPLELINSLDRWFTIPTHYSEPLRIEVGMTFSF